MNKHCFLLICLLITSYNYAQVNQNKPLPIVFVHGMLASGDTWVLQLQRFEQQGYTKNMLAVVDWNTIAMGNRNGVGLDSIINHLLQINQVKQVNLVGHSAGGGVCYNYLQQTQNAAKVAHYVHVGSGKMKTPPTVPTLNLYSLEDKITGGANIDGVNNTALTNQDHYEVATSQESFDAMFQFFNNAAAATAKTSTPKKITVGGRVVSFGENKPEANATITVFAINAIEGKRKNSKSIFTTTTDFIGNWNGFIAAPNEYYEFVVQSADTAKRAVHYFREPFTHNNSLVYLRTLSNKGMTGMIAQQLPANDNQSVLAVFSANKAVINGRDSLTVNGINLTDKKFATAEKTSIAFFLYDDGDGKSSTNKHAGFGMLPFMNMVDVFLPANSKSIQLYFNGRKMNIPAMSSLEEGIMVAVFD
jgi:hypothetical protein